MLLNRFILCVCIDYNKIIVVCILHIIVGEIKDDASTSFNKFSMSIKLTQMTE